MPIDRRALAQLARPFEGGNGPTRSSAKSVFENAGAGDYFSDEGNKYETVMNGLTALLKGSRATAEREALTANMEMLQDVVYGLAAQLNARGDLDDETTARILNEPTAAPASPATADQARGSAPQTTSLSVGDRSRPRSADGACPVIPGRRRSSTSSAICSRATRAAACRRRSGVWPAAAAPQGTPRARTPMRRSRSPGMPATHGRAAPPGQRAIDGDRPVVAVGARSDADRATARVVGDERGRAVIRAPYPCASPREHPP